jgi:hypothetical protein
MRAEVSASSNVISGVFLPQSITKFCTKSNKVYKRTIEKPNLLLDLTPSRRAAKFLNEAPKYRTTESP